MNFVFLFFECLFVCDYYLNNCFFGKKGIENVTIVLITTSSLSCFLLWNHCSKLTATCRIFLDCFATLCVIFWLLHLSVSFEVHSFIYHKKCISFVLLSSNTCKNISSN